MKSMEPAEKARRAGYLCGGCAENLGGVWPRRHRATFHGAECPICRESKRLAAWDDWEWPDSRLNRQARQSREI